MNAKMKSDWILEISDSVRRKKPLLLVAGAKSPSLEHPVPSSSQWIKRRKKQPSSKRQDNQR
jgi:hypothetical protein